MSSPATVPEPAVGARIPQSMRMVVDLPAPLGPRNPKISPLLTSKDTRFTATKEPNRFSRSFTMTAWSGLRMAGTAFLVGENGDKDILECRNHLPHGIETDARSLE